MSRTSATPVTVARRGHGRLLVLVGVGCGLLAGGLWLLINVMNDFDYPNDDVRRASWVILVVAVCLAALPAALGFRWLGVRSWWRAYPLGLLVAGPAALVLVLWEGSNNGWV